MRVLFAQVLIVVAFLALGCSTGTPVAAPNIASDPLPMPSTLLPYHIKPQDLLEVRFYNNPELDAEQPVRPDGQISLPFVGQIMAAGSTVEQLETELAKRYESELTQPDISVVLREFAPQRVYVGGEVGVPGAVEIHGPLTLFQAIQLAGGFTDASRVRQVVVIRQLSEDDWQGRAVDLDMVRSGAAPMSDPPLIAQDIVYVPRTKIANVNLWVRRYVRDLSPINLSLGVFWNPAGE